MSFYVTARIYIQFMKLNSWSITWITKIILTSTTWWNLQFRVRFFFLMKLNSWSITWITKITLTSTTWWKIIGRWLRKSSGATTWTRQLSYKLAKHKHVHFHLILCGGGSHYFCTISFLCWLLNTLYSCKVNHEAAHGLGVESGNLSSIVHSILGTLTTPLITKGTVIGWLSDIKWCIEP